MAAEFPASSLALPETWPTVTEVAVSGTTLYYRLGTPAPLRDAKGRYVRDRRGRLAIEAFLALPLSAMHERLATYLASVPAWDPDFEFDQARLRAAFAEVIAFVERFGPLGMGWSRTYQATNPEAERLAADYRALRQQVPAANPPTADSLKVPPGVLSGTWHVVLPELGHGLVGEVRPVRTYPGLAWERRVRLDDDGIPHDRLGTFEAGPLSLTHRVLTETIGLVDALATGNPHTIRDALEQFSRFERLVWVGSEPVDTTALNWRLAVRGIIPGGGLWNPFAEHRGHVDWMTLGWTALAQHLSRQLTWGALRVGLRRHDLQLGWRAGSLIEVMYLQLLEHVTQHPDFGTATCDYCGAPILRVRRDQHYHSGCAPAGRQRESRAARKAKAAMDAAS